MQQWRARLPSVDASPLLVIGRIDRLASVCDALLRPLFAEAGLAPGDFDVLAALRRSPAPHARSNGDLARATLVTAGAVTKRIDRLVDAALVRRTRDSGDGRGRVLTLTVEGRRLVDRLIRAHLENARAILSGLDDDDRERLGRLLGKLLAAVESGAP